LSDSASALPDPFSTSLSGRRLGRYEVLARLASGGMAAVYVGRALGVAGFERLFAVKVLHPHLAHEQEFITMFLDEARLAARIRHPNVVPTIDISDTQDAGYYLVMDYIEGDHLGALLQRAYKLGTRLPFPVALRIMVDALEGLAAAHGLTDESGRRINLVHRDVSPHNIMVSTDGIARITDFGVAKAEVRLSTTRQGQFKGKLAYMAPEHASTGEADQRSDLFSVAIILWECLTGTRLFRAENQAATLNKICIEPIPMPSAVDPALEPFDTVLARGLARDLDERYQTAEEFAEAIEERADTLGGLANQRAVAKLVREYAAEKIDRDRELIRSAIADVGTPSFDQGAPVPAPPGGFTYAASAPHAGAPPIAMPNPVFGFDAGTSRRWPIWLLGLLVFVAAGLGIGSLLMRKDTAEVKSSPLDSTPAAAAPDTAAPPAALPPVVEPARAAEGPAAPVAEPAVPGQEADQPGDAARAEADPAPSQARSADEMQGDRPRRDTDRTRRSPVAGGERDVADKPPPDRTRKPKPPPPPPPSDILLNPYRTQN
jgi:eukaryotic-like serine/threonine-protein kinase